MSAPEPTVENALLFMAGRCDGARDDDGSGFSAFDVNLGHSLAEKVSQGITLTGKQRRAAYRMLRKYSGQLRAGGIDFAAIEVPKVEEPRPADGQVSPESVGMKDENRVHLLVLDDRIVAKTPFKYKDVCKTVPAARWTPGVEVPGFRRKGAWTYPSSPTSALALREAFASAKPIIDAAFETLCAAAEEQRSAAVHKDAEDLPPVPLTKTDAWLHQQRAFWFGKPQEAVMLAMDMGTGKSKVIIDLMVNNDAKRVLIFAPSSVVPGWPNQFRTHSGVEWHVENGWRKNKNGEPYVLGVAERVRLFDDLFHECRCGRPHAAVVNYEVIPHEPFKSWSLEQAYDYLVFDESHRIRSAQGVWSKHAAKMAKRANRRAGLSGTPMTQSPLDVFGQYRALDPHIFGTSWTSFQRRYAVMGGYGGYEVLGYQNEDELNAKFYSIAYRVGAEVLDLPPDNDVTRACVLGPKARKAYNEIENDLFTEVGDGSEISVPNVLVKLLRLQQITGGAVNDDDGNTVEIDTAKAKLLEEVLSEEIAPTEPVVVFTRFVHDLDAVKKVAEKLGRRYGEISGRRKDGLDENSRMPAGLDVVAVQIQSGGVGIDLTRARYCIYYSLGYSLGDYLQSRRRVLRPGQDRPVLFIHLVAAGTKDEDVYEALEAREEVVESILNRMTGKDKAA